MPNDPFYRSKAWLGVRAQALKRDGYRCVICGADVRGKGQSRVDHIEPRRLRPDLALALSNLRTLCPTCDNQGHREKRGGGVSRIEQFVVKGLDPAGRPLDPAHPWHRPRNGMGGGLKVCPPPGPGPDGASICSERKKQRGG